jgi:hypothetical protein
MPLLLLIGLCGWLAITVFVLAICRLAARGDAALMAEAAHTAEAVHTEHRALAPHRARGSRMAPTSRALTRAVNAGHGSTPRARAR